MLNMYMSKIKYDENISFIYSITYDVDFRGSNIIKRYAYNENSIKDLVPPEIVNDILKKILGG